MRKFVLICVCILGVESFNFDVENVKEIHLYGDGTSGSSYFGYALLLQKGANPTVIVGAPKDSAINGGALYACDALNEGGCKKYSVKTSNFGTFNGNFLGAAIDGDENQGQPFIVCAPREVSQLGFKNPNYFMKGSCFYQENSNILEGNRYNLYPLDKAPSISFDNEQKINYYDNAFGQAGIDIHYVKELRKALLGAPGVKNWHGAIVSQSLTELEKYDVIPRIRSLLSSMDMLGYSVASSKLGNSIFFIAGAPRANDLLGMVKLYNGSEEIRTFHGQEMGSYFGSSLLSVDINNDSIEDLFIGAPMAAGKTYDEGYVYVYENAIFNNAKLVGSKKVGARFGTTIAALGDIDLDSYNDIAVSAPFEDDGTGAVYIYMGSRQGIEPNFAQRLSPKEFNGPFVNVRGFGVGLSKGNDVDGNGHNDVAIGAYKSGQVFIVRTKPVVDLQLSLDANVTTLTTNKASHLGIVYCIQFHQRSSKKNLKWIDLNVTLSLDYRVQGQQTREETFRVVSGNLSCRQVGVVTQPSLAITPFGISLSVSLPAHLVGRGEKKMEKQIPFSHGCGDDNVCETRISLGLKPEKSSIVLGLDNQIDVTVTTENKGEPGYQCQLHLVIPDEVELRKSRECNSENATHLICPFASTLPTVKEVKLKFDVVSNDPTSEKIEIGFEVKCMGENLGDSAKTVTIGLAVQNSPYIEGSADPQNVYYDIDAVKNDIVMTHTFAVGNFGPSPVKLDVYLLMPMIRAAGTDIFELVEAKGTLHDAHFHCLPWTRTVGDYKNHYEVKTVLTESVNRTILFDCFQQDVQCLEVLCQGGYLYKSSEVAKFDLKVKMNSKLLASYFYKQLQQKDMIAYIANGFIFNTTRIDGYSTTLIFASQHTKPISVWVWILAAILGLVALCLLIFFLYKFNFFQRSYRDKMNDERILDNNETDNDGNSSETLE